LSSLHDGSNVPSRLIEIYDSMDTSSGGLKSLFIHPSVQPMGVSTYNVSSIYSKIQTLYNSLDNRNSSLLKNLANYVLTEWIDKDEQQGRKLFPNTFQLRADLLFNVC
jgi:hypothetical protein